MVDRLTQGLGADDAQIYRTDSPLDLSELMELVELDRPDLKNEPWVPVDPPGSPTRKSISRASSTRFDAEMSLFISRTSRTVQASRCSPRRPSKTPT